MAEPPDQAIVDRLKQSLRELWDRIHRDAPGERVYAFGVYTSPCADFAAPFACGEQGLQQVAAEYVARGTYPASGAAANLRWSVADSPYADGLDEWPNPFAGRPDAYGLPATASAREIRFRLNAACRALKELDAEGLFGTGDDRPLLWLEGGDVNDAWLNGWAKKLNPPAAFARFKARGEQQPEPIGTFTEFGTKKVYQTSRYAASAGGIRLVAASNYHLFLFDTTGPMKQVGSRQLPDRSDAEVVWDVATSADAGLTAVTLFGMGKHRRSAWLLSGPKWAEVTPVPMPADPTAVAVDPAGRWVAIGCGDGSAAVIDPAGRLITQLSELHGREHYHSDMAVNPDGSLLAWANGQGTVHVWNTANWSARPAIRDRADGVSFDPSGRLVIATLHYTHLPENVMRARGRLARVFDATTGQVVRDLAVPGFCIARAVFSPDGGQVACALKVDSEQWAGVNEVALVDVASGRVLDRLKADFESVYDFAFLPHRGEIAVAVFGHTRRPLVLWKAKTLEAVAAPV